MSDYIPDDRDLTACPACGSGRLLCMVTADADLDLCATCGQAWERLPPGEPYTTDGEQLPFAVPCDNCAFRGGSQERQDPDAWAALQHTLAIENGGRFYCHKAVPFTIPAPGILEHGFNFPKKPGHVIVEGASHAYQHYDTDRMRLCRGYLNAHVGPLVKRAFSESEDSTPQRRFESKTKRCVVDHNGVCTERAASQSAKKPESAGSGHIKEAK